MTADTRGFRETKTRNHTNHLADHLLVVIGGAAVTRRALRLFASSTAPASLPEAALNAGFAQHPALTMTHIIPGLLFIALAPLQFVRTLRARRAVLRRWTRRVVIVSGMIIGCTALVMDDGHDSHKIRHKFFKKLHEPVSEWP